MPSLRVLSGREVIAALGEFGFHRAMQRGSHVKLQRATPESEPAQAGRHLSELTRFPSMIWADGR